MAYDAERNGGYRGRKDRARRVRDALRHCNGPEAGAKWQDQRDASDDQRRADHHQTFGPYRIDHRAGGRLRNNAGKACDRHHHADAGFVPFLLGQEIDGEVGPEPVADIGQEEIGGIEGAVGTLS